MLAWSIFVDDLLISSNAIRYICYELGERARDVKQP